MNRRLLREIGVISLVAVTVATVVAAAVQADGRTSVRADTNDGGAWLARRSDGVVGHLNRAVGEVSGVIRVAEPFADFDVEQAEGSLVVHDRNARLVSVLDPRTFQSVNAIEVPDGAKVAATDGGAVISTSEPLGVWVLDRDTLGSIGALGAVPAAVAGEGRGAVTVGSDGTVHVLDLAGDRLVRIVPGAAEQVAIPLDGHLADATLLTTVARDLVAVTPDGLVTVDAEATTTEAIAAAVDAARAVGTPDEIGALQQAAPAGDGVVVARRDGTVILAGGAGAGDDAAVVEVDAIGAAEPLAPIVHDGCIFTVGLAPPTFTRMCGGVADQTEPLTGADPDALRLRLVNGWVWINDLTNGTAWIAGAETNLERIDDWGTALGQDGADPDAEQQGNEDDDEQQTEENPDVGEIRGQEIDEDGVNEPPIARDDVARTRVDQPVVVDVLANDEDPDGDALMVVEVAGAPDGVAITTTADQTGIQVVPRPGEASAIEFGYTISDGRGATASARVSVEVSRNDASSRPPVAVTDIAEVRGGASAAFNVLNNDYDPDGDTFVLSDVTAPSGRVVFDPSGEITYTPEPNSAAGTIELEYQITDSFGEVATGVVRVAIRLDTSNNEPDAVNDTAVTVVNKPVTFNVMQNDSDPDNDPLTIAGLPQLVQTSGNPDALQEISLTDDGEFFFLPSVAGDYVFLYAIIDGSERDAAYIRVRVDAAGENRPPVAVRDDVTIARGDARNVYVLENDMDPDGDVVGIVGWSQGRGLEVEQIQGLGFRVTVLADAPEQSQFSYSISDGQHDAVTGTVVVAVSDNAAPDQPPIARPDTVEVRAGATTSARVLVNDYDPEGTTLRVVGVSSSPDAQLRVGPGGQEIFVSVAADTTTSFSFGYDVADESGNQTGSLVQVRLVPEGEANRPPVARPDVARTVAGQAIDIPVLRNDSDPDGDAIQLESVAAQPLFGAAAVRDDGTIRYEPGAELSGSDRLRYTVVDANGDRAVGEVLIGVLPADGDNRAPTATNDAYTVIAGSDQIAFDVLANDFDPDGDLLAITDLTASTDIVALDTATGQVTVTPPPSLALDREEVAFNYSIADGRGGVDDALVTVEIVEAAEPIAPIAVDDLVGPVRVGDSISVDVLANDSDPDGRLADLTVTGDDPRFPVDVAGMMRFTDLQETTEARYSLVDADGQRASGLVTVVVLDNVAPTAPPLTVETEHDTPISIDLAANADDADGDTLFFTCCDGTRGGTADVAESAADTLSVTFTPSTGFTGQAAFAYTVDDQNGHRVSGAVTVVVAPPANTAPTATDGTVEVEAGRATPVDLGAYVEDPDVASGDVLSFAISGDAPATVSRNAVTVSPPIDATGSSYAIPFTVTDRLGEAATATLTVTVTEPNVPPPSAVGDAMRTTQDAPIPIPVLANDIDPLGQGLRIVGANVTDGSGTATVAGDQVVYAPNPDYFGEATFTYTIEDARRTENGRAVGTVAVTVIGRPGQPTTPQATADNATATVTWGLPDAHGAPLQAIEVAVDDGTVLSLEPTSTHTFTGLTNGQPVRFRVRANNEAGWGPWSEWSAAVTPDTQPGRPNTPAVTFGDQELTIDWTAPPNEGSAITGYEIEIGGGTSGVQSWGTTTTYTWSGLTNGTNYQFRIVAINAAGRSVASPWSQAEHPLREPDAPGQPVATRGNRYLDLAWPAADPNGDPVIEYRVEMRSQQGTFVSVGSATNTRWSNLDNGVEQQFRVQARNRDADWSQWSEWSVPVKPCTVPDTPAAPTATRGDQSATVAYVPPDDQGCAISQIQVRTGSTDQVAAGSPHTFTGLTNGTSYQFEVRAQNEEGWGAWSPASNAVTPAGAPIGPGSINASASGVRTVSLSWPAANANGTALTDYQISVNNGAAESVGIRTSYDRTGLGDSSEYRFKVRACNNVGCGAWSPDQAATTNGPPNRPGAPNASASNGRVEANWSRPGGNGLGVDRYQVEIDPGGTAMDGNTSHAWNVQNGRSYRVRVRAENAAGWSPWSPWSQSVTPQAPAPEPSIRVAFYGDAQGQPGCSTSLCRFVRVEGFDLRPNTTYTVDCHYSSVPGGFSPTSVTTNGNGYLVDAPACWYGYRDAFWGTITGHGVSLRGNLPAR